MKKAQWFTELAKSKSYPTSKRVPLLQSEECLNAVYEYKIPIMNAVWLLKMTQVAQDQQQKQEKQQTSKTKKPMESYDYTLIFIKIIKDLLDKMDDEATAADVKQKWKYYSMLIRHSVLVSYNLHFCKHITLLAGRTGESTRILF